MVTDRIATTVAPAQRGALWLWVLRLVSAGLLLGIGWIHYDLYHGGYSGIPVIGPAFLLNAIGGVILAVGVVGTPRRFLAVVTTLSWLFTVGTLLALVLSLTLPDGIFGFREDISAPQVTTAIWVESAAILELAAFTLVAWRLTKKR